MRLARSSDARRRGFLSPPLASEASGSRPPAKPDAERRGEPEGGRAQPGIGEVASSRCSTPEGVVPTNPAQTPHCYRVRMSRLRLERDQLLAYRRRVSLLDQRLPAGPESLHLAAWAGLTDSMPRAAVLSIHARVEGTTPATWEDPSFVQVWGPRFSVYVVAAQDLAVFSLGRLPESGPRRKRAEDLAALLHALLDGSPPIPFGEAGGALGLKDPNVLRYAATTGTVLIRWEGAHQPTMWTVPAPGMDPAEARRELVRRHLHIFGPSTPEAFSHWAGIRRGERTFFDLGNELVPVDTPIGDAWILAKDEDAFLGAPLPPAPARLLPSGDTYYLLWGRDRELLVDDDDQRQDLWTSRVWPGAVLADGEIVGTWRRTRGKLTVFPWGELTKRMVDAIETEAMTLPLTDEITVSWGE